MKKIVISCLLLVTVALSLFSNPITITLPHPPKGFDRNITIYILRKCEEMNIPYLLVFKLIEHESNWDINARGENWRHVWKNGKEEWILRSVDFGLMQLNSIYVKYFINVYGKPNIKYDPIKNPYQNVELGLSHLKAMYSATENWYDALRAYNAGISNMESSHATNYANFIDPVKDWWTLASLTNFQVD